MNLRFKLCRSTIAVSTKLLPWIIVKNFFICCRQDHLKTQNGRHALGINGRKLGLVHHRNICHPECCRLPVRADDKFSFRNGYHPKQPQGPNPWIKIVNFVLRSNLLLKEGESYMGERSGLRSTCREVFTLHNPEIGAWRAKCNAVALIVRAHADEIRAPGDSPFEMVDVQRL